MKEIIKPLKQVVCVFLDAHMWSGRKKLKREDIKVDTDKLPPADLASLGAKKLIDPQELRPFMALIRRAERACLAVGVRFLGGWAIPEAKAADLALELDNIKAEFEVEKVNFLAHYDQAVEDWIARHAAWEGIIRKAVTPRSYIERQLRFESQLFKITTTDAGANGLDRSVENLGGRVIYEVSRAAQVAFEKSFMNRTEVTQKALNPINALLDKMEGLAFLDQRVEDLVEEVKGALAKLPRRGKIEGQDLLVIHGILNKLIQAPKTLKAEVFDDEDDEVASDETVAAAVEETVAEEPAGETLEANPQVDEDEAPDEVLPEPAVLANQAGSDNRLSLNW